MKEEKGQAEPQLYGTYYLFVKIALTGLLNTGIVPSLLGFNHKERSLPKEESMPVLSASEKLFDYLPFTQQSGSSALSVLSSRMKWMREAVAERRNAARPGMRCVG